MPRRNLPVEVRKRRRKKHGRSSRRIRIQLSRSRANDWMKNERYDGKTRLSLQARQLQFRRRQAIGAHRLLPAGLNDVAHRAAKLLIDSFPEAEPREKGVSRTRTAEQSVRAALAAVADCSDIDRGIRAAMYALRVAYLIIKRGTMVPV